MVEGSLFIGTGSLKEEITGDEAESHPRLFKKFLGFEYVITKGQKPDRFLSSLKIVIKSGVFFICRKYQVHYNAQDSSQADTFEIGDPDV